MPLPFRLGMVVPGKWFTLCLATAWPSAHSWRQVFYIQNLHPWPTIHHPLLGSQSPRQSYLVSSISGFSCFAYRSDIVLSTELIRVCDCGSMGRALVMVHGGV